MRAKFKNKTHDKWYLLKKMIPTRHDTPIIAPEPGPAFTISAEEIIFSIKQQFTSRELALRELGQNSQDAGATSIRVDWRYEEGKLVMEFLDNGCGMDLGTIQRHYLRLFDSSKEMEKNKVGRWSLGRLTLLCYEPDLIEVVTMTENSTGYRLEIKKNLSGKLYEMDRSDAFQILGCEHGTLVRMAVAVKSLEEFVAMAGAGNNSMERELPWIKPELTVTTVQIKDGNLTTGSKRLNRPLEVPGRYSRTLTVRMSTSGGEVRCAIGLTPATSANLAPVTLCCGGIPIERPSELPWRGKKDFSIKGVTIILDSYAFKTNIGRNVVYRDHFLTSEFLPAFFHKVVREFVRTMAKLFSQPGARYYEYLEPMRNLMADFCLKGDKFGFEIPDEVLQTPFIESYVSFKPYSLAELDRCKGEIYYTYERPTMLCRSDLSDGGSGQICLCLADLAWEFREYLEKRYNGRLKKKESSVVVKDHRSSEFISMAEGIRRRLWPQANGVERLFDMFNRSLSDPIMFKQLRVGRFMRFDGTDDSTTPTLSMPESNAIYLNHNHPHIRNLITLINDADISKTDLGVHFLLRELYFDPTSKFAINERERFLTRDLCIRFSVSDEVPETLDWLAEYIDDDTQEFILDI